MTYPLLRSIAETAGDDLAAISGNNLLALIDQIEAAEAKLARIAGFADKCERLVADRGKGVREDWEYIARSLREILADTMNDGFTPTTATVRSIYVTAAAQSPSLRAAEFDRWLAQHDAEVKAEALREAVLDPRIPAGSASRTLLDIATEHARAARVAGTTGAGDDRD